MRHVLSLFDLSADEIREIFQVAKDLKNKYEQGIREPLLAGRVLALLFEKPSLRTRVSFESAFTHLGGNCQFLGADVGWGHRESPADFSRVLTQYVDVLVCRAKNHTKVQQLADYADCPVINGLTDLYHPCQALTDLFTLQELHGSLQGKSLAFVGDANNVARSLAIACGYLGVHFVLACPSKYQFSMKFLQTLEEKFDDLQLTVTTDPFDAVRRADGIYTDVWASMGQEDEISERRTAFAEYQVNRKLMAAAPAGARFLHCLPAHRGQEVTDEVADSPQSAIVQQAANRMHVQKGLLAWLLKS
jgi:ornithine carbamoyltransferase